MPEAGSSEIVERLRRVARAEGERMPIENPRPQGQPRRRGTWWWAAAAAVLVIAVVGVTLATRAPDSSRPAAPSQQSSDAAKDLAAAWARTESVDRTVTTSSTEMPGGPITRQRFDAANRLVASDIPELMAPPPPTTTRWFMAEIQSPTAIYSTAGQTDGRWLETGLDAVDRDLALRPQSLRLEEAIREGACVRSIAPRTFVVVKVAAQICPNLVDSPSTDLSSVHLGAWSDLVERVTLDLDGRVAVDEVATNWGVDRHVYDFEDPEPATLPPASLVVVSRFPVMMPIKGLLPGNFSTPAGTPPGRPTSVCDPSMNGPLFGRTLDNARAIAAAGGKVLRIASVDGTSEALTADGVPNRIDVALVAGRVVSACAS